MKFNADDVLNEVDGFVCHMTTIFSHASAKDLYLVMMKSLVLWYPRFNSVIGKHVRKTL